MSYKIIDVKVVSYDPQNPRIKMALEKYGENLNDERIKFALQSATDGTKGASSYTQLKDSIRASGGVMAPIIVRGDKEGRYVCIDGNTRLAVYREFLAEGIAGDWTRIKAIELEDSHPRFIEETRVSAHLVGAREWPAYEKARYLHYLRNQKFMEYSQMIELCGGNRVDIERQIAAFEDMNRYYRDLVDDTAFHIDRFSGFVEVQKSKVKNAIFEAGFEMGDFGKWISEGNIYKLANVRDLPKVLRNDEAKKIFVEGGYRSIEEAIRFVDEQSRQQINDRFDQETLKEISVYQLSEIMARRISEIPFGEIQALKSGEQEDAEERILTIEELFNSLENFLDLVSE